jgi:hypothetical protein
MDAKHRFDVFLLRGAPVCQHAARRRALHGRLAFYITDFPQPPAKFGWWDRRRMRHVVRASSLLLCQTSELQAYLESELSLKDAPPRRILPPAVTEDAFAFAPARAPTSGEPLQLIYIGKFAPAWRTLEMCRLPQALAARGIACELHVAGDKFLSRPDPDFPERMKAALRLPGVTWHGALSQRDALALAASCHVGMSWRSVEFDSSLELSTKLLEYGALGLSVLCNPTAMHRSLLGEDYPLFVSDEKDVLRAAASAAHPAVWRVAHEKTYGIAEAYRASRVGASLRQAMTEIFA